MGSREGVDSRQFRAASDGKHRDGFAKAAAGNLDGSARRRSEPGSHHFQSVVRGEERAVHTANIVHALAAVNPFEISFGSKCAPRLQWGSNAGALVAQVRQR